MPEDRSHLEPGFICDQMLDEAMYACEGCDEESLESLSRDSSSE
jgi:hypothetical protein